MDPLTNGGRHYSYLFELRILSYLGQEIKSIELKITFSHFTFSSMLLIFCPRQLKKPLNSKSKLFYGIFRWIFYIDAKSIFSISGSRLVRIKLGTGKVLASILLWLNSSKYSSVPALPIPSLLNTHKTFRDSNYPLNNFLFHTVLIF